MKFLDEHRKSIAELISQYGFSQEEFSYVKRKGRINIIHNHSNKRFGYLRKKETSIDETSKQWLDVTYYKVDQNADKEIIRDSWALVLKDFEQWLKELDV